ncbi:MAG: nuclear transport factor 2 family protein [Actinomycetota bacterium]
MKAREVVDRYVARANARDVDALMQLFAEDAVVEHETGRFEGRDAIREFFADTILPANSIIGIAAYEDRADGCRVVFEDTGAGRQPRVVDRFLLDDDGRIAHLHITVE